MKFNCNKLIVAAFKLEESLFAPYYDQLIAALSQSGHSLQDGLKLVSE
jgi:hypothetical protein